MFVIFDFSLGQRSFFYGRPHDGFRPLIKGAVHDEFHKLARNHRFCMVIHCFIRIIPITRDAQTFKLFALNRDPFIRKAAAFLAKGHDIHIILIAAFGTILLFYLPLNGQAMTIPTWHIARVFTHHLLRAHYHIFKNFIQRMADVQMAIGIGGAIMQGKARTACFFAQTVVNADLAPHFEPFGFTLGQASAHREIGLW